MRDGDGLPETVLAATFTTTPHGPRDLYCFAPNGKILWHYRPTFDLTFKAQAFSGTARFLDVLVVPAKPWGTIWAASSDVEWWPSFLDRISPDGATKRTFVNSGNIRVVQRIQSGRGSYILAAGTNNEYRRAFLAILRPDDPASASPQSEGSEFQCLRGCPGTLPYRYILLPRSELNTFSLTPYNMAEKIVVRQDGFVVETDEKLSQVSGFYDFSSNFQPERMAYSDNYKPVHEQLEREGRIKHSWADCPERTTPAVVRICDQNGHRTEQNVPRVHTGD